MGNDAGALAATGQYDEDDKEADEIWEAVDNFMDERRRVRACYVEGRVMYLGDL
jgi:pre-mRNA-processing factor 6